MTPHMYWATGAYLVMATGLGFRKNRKIHVPAMLIAMAADLALVLLLQFQRNAIATAMPFTLSPLQQAHVGASTTAMILYFPTIYFGVRRWRGTSLTPKERQSHIRFGLLAFFFRTLGFLLMFSLLGQRH